MKLYLLHLKSVSIHDQLLLEEKLLRASLDNFCIINHGSSRHIVMGISGKVEELLNTSLVKQENIPVLKRFSGGGTVVVDENTVFITFIFNAEDHDFPAFPERIHKWSEGIYTKAFKDIPFSLRENDYVIGVKKVGGNAQYIKKDRWLHHTSFLWDYKTENMQMLLLPKKRPKYREDRKHEDFLCTLKEFFNSKEEFISNVEKELHSLFEVEKVDHQNFTNLEPSRISTNRIDV